MNDSSDELDEWFQKVAKELVAAGWTGQELQVTLTENDDGTSDVVFDWED